MRHILKTRHDKCEEFLTLRLSRLLGRKAQADYRAIYRGFIAFSGKTWQGVSEDDVLAYRNRQLKRIGRYGRLLSPKTVARELSILSKAYDDLMRAGLVSRNPVHPFKMARPSDAPTVNPHKLIEKPDILRLLRELPQGNFIELRDKVTICLLYAGGLRISELLNLPLGGLRVTSKNTPYVVLERTKGKSDVCHGLDPRVMPLVEKYLEVRAEVAPTNPESYFLTNHGGGRVSYTTLYRRIKTAFQKFRIDATTHSLRASAITHLLDAGNNHRKVREFSRHASVAMVEVYDKRRTGVDEGIQKNLLDVNFQAFEQGMAHGKKNHEQPPLVGG